MFAISGLTCLAIVAGMSWFEWQYRASAQTTQGTVIRKLSSRSSRRTGTVASFVFRYQYQTAPGKTFEDEDHVSESYWDEIRTGDSVRIFYLPTHPGHSRLWLGIRWFGEFGEPEILLLVGALTTLMGVGAAFAVVSDRRLKNLKKQQAALARRERGALPKL